jgi:hypothetical protein
LRSRFKGNHHGWLRVPRFSRGGSRGAGRRALARNRPHDLASARGALFRAAETWTQWRRPGNKRVINVTLTAPQRLGVRLPAHSWLGSRAILKGDQHEVQHSFRIAAIALAWTFRTPAKESPSVSRPFSRFGFAMGSSPGISRRVKRQFPGRQNKDHRFSRTRRLRHVSRYQR